MTKDEASYLSSAGQVAHLVSRIICIIITYCAPLLHIEKIMITCVIGVTVAQGVYVFAGLRHVPWIWIGTILIQLTSQALWPGGLLWAENYIHVYQIIVSIGAIAQGVSGMVSGWVNGHLFDIDPQLPFKVGFVLSCMFTVTFLILVVIARWFSKTYKKEDMDKSDHEYTQALLEDDELDLEDEEIVGYREVDTEKNVQGNIR